VEPVFGNIRSTKRLSRFSVRGRRKVNTQWLLFCMMHILGRYNDMGCRRGEGSGRRGRVGGSEKGLSGGRNKGLKKRYNPGVSKVENLKE